jgi:enamine deaminase RidA (YjgF/YER057c/UK114 family)
MMNGDHGAPSTLGDEPLPELLPERVPISAMSARPPDDENKTNEPCTIVRRFAGPEADEIFLLCRPDRTTSSVARQAESACKALRDLFASHGASYEHVVSETVFFRHVRQDLNGYLQARRQVFGEPGGRSCPHPATTFVEQPPLNDGGLEVAAHAVIPRRPDTGSAWTISPAPTSERGERPPLSGRCTRVGDQTYLVAGNVYGAGGNAFDETHSMFCSAEALLQEAGMTFRDVVRTWIYVRDIDRDYDDFNRARRAFFRQRGITVRPASTGIGGGSPFDGQAFSMSLHAMKSSAPLQIDVMRAPSLNEAWTYGSDFSRGLKVVEANKIALYISGTASVDEAGRTVHVGDFEAQVERMLMNISSLLAAHGASFRNLVSAITYLKNPGDAQRLREIFHERGFDGFPTALVEAPVCRPDLLCEAEAVAVLPLPHPK